MHIFFRLSLRFNLLLSLNVKFVLKGSVAFWLIIGQTFRSATALLDKLQSISVDRETCGCVTHCFADVKPAIEYCTYPCLSHTWWCWKSHSDPKHRWEFSLVWITFSTLYLFSEPSVKHHAWRVCLHPETFFLLIHRYSLAFRDRHSSI